MLNLIKVTAKTKVVSQSDKGLKDNPWKQWCYNWFIGGYRDDRFDRGFGEEL